MRVFFARHGESEANVARVYSIRGWKHPLTAQGREQARALADRLTGRDVMAVYSSPIRRAVETALILSAQLGVPHVTDPALAEYDVGMYEGHHYDDAPGRVVDLEASWDRGELETRLPGGESCNDVLARFVPFVERLVAQFEREQVSLVVVGHGGTFRHALPKILTNVEAIHAPPLVLKYAGVVEAELEGGVLRCVRWGDEPRA